MSEIANKFIIHNCPAIYEYYPIGKERQKCCYCHKEDGQHKQCKDVNWCYLKEMIEQYTFKKGSIQEFLQVEHLEEVKDEYRCK